MHDAVERVVNQRDVAGLLGNAGTRAQRETYMGTVQGRGIVGAIACDGYHLTTLLQQAHQTLLVSRTGTRHDLQLLDALQRLFITQCGKLRTRDELRRSVIP